MGEPKKLACHQGQARQRRNQQWIVCRVLCSQVPKQRRRVTDCAGRQKRLAMRFKSRAALDPPLM